MLRLLWRFFHDVALDDFPSLEQFEAVGPVGEDPAGWQRLLDSAAK